MMRPLRISEAASLALHAAAVVASAENAPTSAAGIAELLGASRAHLSKVLARLSKAGIVRGTTGPGGGFTLSRPAREISLLEIYESVEGPLETDKCLFDLPICEPSTCPLSQLFCDVNARIASRLESTTLDQFRVPARPIRGDATTTGRRDSRTTDPR